MLTLKTILHPTDLSERSDFAFRLACSLASAHGARVIVLHVFEVPTVPYGGVMTPPPAESPEEQARVRDQVRRLQSPVPGVGVETRLAHGDPAAEILHAAHETGCDLIVMGTHGRTGLARLLLGSVAEKVLRAASCPVLTAKGPPAVGESKA
ncbi:MAG: universal stress protein [Gemmataceae bacterium]|nr:universal stress protein [Gemmataceae bacterium]